jgi:hypothetical protein
LAEVAAGFGGESKVVGGPAGEGFQFGDGVEQRGAQLVRICGGFE